MITQNEISTLLHQPVYGDGGQKIGEAKDVFYDDATGRPEWVTVKTGLLGGSASFVPVRDAVVAQGHLEVPYSKDKIKGAPNVDVDAKGHLAAREEHRLYDFYGIDPSRREYAAAAPVGGKATGRQPAGPARNTAGPATAATAAAGTARPGKAATGTANAVRGGTTAVMPAGETMTRSEEEMHVRVERHETGRARLHKYVETEEQQQTVPVRHEEVRLVREPITDANRGEAMSGPELAEAERVVTLHAEKPVVETTVQPKERVRLAVEERTEQQTIRGRVRKEQIKLENVEEEERGR